MNVGDLVVVSLPLSWREIITEEAFDGIHGKIGLVTGFEDLVYGEPTRVQILLGGNTRVFSVASLKKVHESG